MTTSEELARTKGMMSVGEVGLLKKCAAMLPENPVVIIIGAGFGTSSLAVLEERPDAFIFSIDIKPKPEEVRALIGGGVDFSRCIRILSPSPNVGYNFPYEVEMVFIDGRHTDHGVQADINAWLPNVPNGIMLFHDYNHPNLTRLTGIVDKAMEDYERIGENRYLVAFKIGE